jgi:hypothetical protein
MSVNQDTLPLILVSEIMKQYQTRQPFVDIINTYDLETHLPYEIRIKNEYNKKNFLDKNLQDLYDFITEFLVRNGNPNIVDITRFYYDITSLLPKTNKELYVFRSIRESPTFQLKEYLESNKPIIQMIPKSTSWDYNYAYEWSKSDAVENWIIFIIKLPADTPVCVISVDDNSEREVMIPPGELKITSLAKTETKMTIVFCDFVMYSKEISLELIKSNQVPKKSMYNKYLKYKIKYTLLKEYKH